MHSILQQQRILIKYSLYLECSRFKLYKQIKNNCMVRINTIHFLFNMKFVFQIHNFSIH